ncbi:MAG: GNAT family N-acetyltransferase [Propionicimonas sp.]
MTSLVIRPPEPADAPEWFDFILEQQAHTYRGIVRPDFAEVQHGYREDWVPALAASFAEPGTARRLIARQDGRVVGAASIVDAPGDWEVEMELIPPPAARCLDRLYLHPELHGRGLGSKLLAAIDDGRDLYLWLIDDNTAAQAFYRRRGFVDEPEPFNTGESWGHVNMHRMVRRTISGGAFDA